MILELTFAALITAGGIMAGPAPPPPPTPYIIQEPTYSGGEVVTEGWVETMDAERLTYIMDELDRLNPDIRAENIASYMTQARFLPELINMAPLMVQLGDEYRIDPRLCCATITAESSGGRGSYNLFGSLAGACGGYEAQVRWYFRRNREIDDAQGFGGDCWRLAWFWYGGGSSMGGKAERYADNVTGVVQSIGGFGGGGSSAE